MNIWKISIQNIKSKPLYTFLSILTLSLSIALLLGIQQLKTSFQHQMNNNLGGIDLVIGAKGSPLQLVLASILHLDNPTGNIPYKEAKKIGKNRLIETAVPISYGDNYKGYKIVGTTHDFAKLYNAELEKGQNFNKSLEAIVGSSVAERLNIKIGDTFLSSHGLVENDIHVHEEEFKVVGILKPTQKVIDRLIVTNLQSVWDVHSHEGHDHENDTHEEKHEEHHKKGEKHEKHSHEDVNHSEKKHHTHNENHHHKEEGDVHYHNGVPHSHSGDEHRHTEHKHDHKDKNKEHQHKEGDVHYHNGVPHSHSDEEHTSHNHEHEEGKKPEDKHEHHDHDHDHDHNDEKEITSLLIKFRSPAALLSLPRKINNDTNMQAALPKYELDRLYEYTGVGFKTISWIAYLILIISGIIIFISLYKMIKERAFDLALLRTYGASNLQLIKMVTYEGLTIILFAFILGFLLVKAGLYFMFTFVKSDYKQNILQDLPIQEVLQTSGLVFVMIIIAILLAIYPIIKMNISTILSNEK